VTASRTRVVLASSSPRRREMLEGAGLDVIVHAPAIDDALLPVRAVHVARDCMALAWFKAAQVLRQERPGSLVACGARAVIAADTACVLGAVALGKPADEHEARTMIEGTVGRDQRVWSGACVMSADGSQRRMLCAAATVRFGEVPRALIDDHIASGRWRGKAGGYDIADLVARRWPVSVLGDEAVVRGMPLQEILRAVAAIRACNRV
jgi:septum formation protein